MKNFYEERINQAEKFNVKKDRRVEIEEQLKNLQSQIPVLKKDIENLKEFQVDENTGNEVKKVPQDKFDVFNQLFEQLDDVEKQIDDLNREKDAIERDFDR